MEMSAFYVLCFEKLRIILIIGKTCDKVNEKFYRGEQHEKMD